MGVDSIRSFFAIPLSHESEQALDDATLALRSGIEDGLSGDAIFRWIPPENYHLTLAFLGQIRRSEIQRLHEIALDTIADVPASEFVLEGFEWFPSAVKPRVLVAVPGLCHPLMDLQKQLSRHLQSEGFHLEKRPFRPHISLARIKGLFQPMDLSAESLDIACELDELVLFSSVQGRGGSVYSPLLVEPIG